MYSSEIVKHCEREDLFSIFFVDNYYDNKRNLHTSEGQENFLEPHFVGLVEAVPLNVEHESTRQRKWDK